MDTELIDGPTVWRRWQRRLLVLWALLSGVTAFTAGVAVLCAALRLSMPLGLTQIVPTLGSTADSVRPIVLLSLVGPAVLVAAAVGRGLRWWHTVIACQVVGVASGFIAFALEPNDVGLALTLVATTCWTAGAAIGGAACAYRRWIWR